MSNGLRSPGSIEPVAYGPCFPSLPQIGRHLRTGISSNSNVASELEGGKKDRSRVRAPGLSQTVLFLLISEMHNGTSFCPPKTTTPMSDGNAPAARSAVLDEETRTLQKTIFAVIQ